MMKHVSQHINSVGQTTTEPDRQQQPSVSRRRFLAAGCAMAGVTLASRGTTSSVTATQLAATADTTHLPVTQRSATTLIAMIRKREISPVELAEAYIRRIKEVEPKLGAVLYLAEEQSVTQARRAQEEIAAGRVDWDCQPLCGLVITVKDNLDTAGMPTTAGSPVWRNRVPTVDATAVQRLKNAGAIVLAKTNLPFIGHAYESSNLFQRTSNPYDLARTAGGSSGGEGAVISAAASPLGLAVDGGGSIRVPSHYCGIAGLRPAYGRVSRAGLVPDGENIGPWSYEGVGPMARYVEDLALMLPVISGPDDRDPFTFPMGLNDYRNVRIPGLRIGVWTGEQTLEAHADTRAAIENAAQVLARQGAHVELMRCPYAPYDLEQFANILTAVVCTSGEENLPKAAQAMGAEDDTLVAACIQYTRECVARIPRGEIEPLKAELAKLRRTILGNVQNYDAMLWPVCRSSAPPHGTSWQRAFHDYEYLHNSISGLVWTLPEGSVRCGTSSEGLPIGVQVIGAPYREDVVLQVMQALETELGGWQLPPAM